MSNRLSLFVLSIAGLSMVSHVSAAVHNVTVRNFEFDPSNVNAQIGDTIQWNWESGFHTVTAGDNNSCTNSEYFPESFITSVNSTYTFVIPANAPAVIPYFCSPHCPSMPGTITVTNAVPTMSEWGMIVLTVAVLAVGGYIAVKRQRVATANA